MPQEETTWDEAARRRALDEARREYEEKRARAELFVAGIGERLVRLAELRPFRFVRTRRVEAEFYLRRLTGFEGYEDGDINWAEQSIDGYLPHVFRAFLRRFGFNRGALFEGSMADDADELLAFRPAADEMVRRCGVEQFLDGNSFVFMLHQGHAFSYFQAENDVVYDSPVLRYTACEPAPRQIAPGFAELLDAELAMMEEANRLERRSGGYLLTVEHGFARRTYPAPSEAPRPVDTEDDLI